MEPAVGYARISDDREGRAVGVGNQRKDIQNKAKRLKWEIVEFYEDNDITADPRKKVRPGFQRLLADMASGKVKRVLCYDQDRLVRDMRELEDIVDAVEAGDVLLTSVNGDIDLRTDNGRMVARIKGSVAKAELEKISRRVRDRIRHDAEEGRKHQGKHRVYGYDREFNIIPEEAQAVREAFERKANGESLTSIAYVLNQKGFRTATNVVRSGPNQGKVLGGGVWDSSLIARMIKRRDYIAEITHNGEVVAQAKWQPIVDRAVWIKANEEADKNQRRGIGARRSILSGFLICDNCGSKMKGGGNKESPRYNCPSPKATNGTSCGSCSIVGPATDEVVLAVAFMKMQEQQEDIESYEPERDWRAEEESIKAEMEKANSYRRAKQLAMEDFVPLMAELREQLNTLLKEEADSVVTDLGSIGKFLDLMQMGLSEIRAWLDRYVSYVVIAKAERVGIKGFKPERLTVHFKDGEVRQIDPDFRYLIHDNDVMTVEEFDKALRQRGMYLKDLPGPL